MTPQISLRRLAVVHGRRADAALSRADRGEDHHAIRMSEGAAVALIDVDLDVYPGEILVILGASGSGKSSLLAAIAGTAATARGSLSTDVPDAAAELGATSRRQLRHHRARVVALANGPGGHGPKMTALAAVMAALAAAGTPRRDRAPRATLELTTAGLRDIAETRIADLAPGLRPRLRLLIAGLGPQPILLLDEAFDTPDALRDPALVNALRQLRERTGKTIVLASRDPGEALRVGDRIAVLDNGRLVQVGTPRDLLLSPATGHVAAFLAELSPVSFLLAEDVMGPIAPGDEAGGFAGLVQTGTPLGRVLPTLGRGDVVVAERGRLLGKIGAPEMQAVFASRI